MNDAKVVIDVEGKFTVISFYGVTVYMGANGKVSKHEGEGLRFMVFSPIGSSFVRVNPKDDFTAADLEQDLNDFLGMKE